MLEQLVRPPRGGTGIGGDYWGHGGGYENSYFHPQPGPGPYGMSDAVYDHDNGLVYNPVGQCLPCHSELYWNGFHEGYDKQWNSYQSTNQGTSINIYGNNNYVSTDQNSAQSPPLLGGIGQGLCNLGYGCGVGEGPDP